MHVAGDIGTHSPLYQISKQQINAFGNVSDEVLIRAVGGENEPNPIGIYVLLKTRLSVHCRSRNCMQSTNKPPTTYYMI